ncbi:MAG TPA: tetratricopeptide repeat protein, partial [Polyangiaceae bacterium]
EPLPDHGRRARSRWIAAVVILGVLTLFALTVGRRYLLESRQSPAAPAEQSNGKVAVFLKNGNRLMDEAQLDEAGEELAKASALAERDPEVLAASARLAVLRADVFWLKLRLLDPKVTELVQSTHRELGRRTGKARASVDSAFAVAPENIVVLRARVDALRLSGDHDAAREWIKPIASQPADPENAYVLAALDLAEERPSWQAVIDRLETAVSSEHAPGRAHAALVYALTRAGRLTEAEAELAKLEASPNGALLLDELRGFFRRHRQTADDGASEKAKVAVDPGKLGRPEPAQTDEPAPAAPAKTGDFRTLLARASEALRRGDVERAQSLYQQVLAQQPGNTEALAGLGDVARRRNDPAAASRMYERVLTENPNYVPALLASADQKWEAGDRKGAVALYRRVLEQAGSGSEYGQRASVRIAQAERAEAEAEAEAAGEPQAPTEDPAPPAPPTEETAPEPPQIDTTDLPEIQR